MTTDKIDYIIGIDPDVDRSGIALLNVGLRKLEEVQALPFPETLEYLRLTYRRMRVKELRMLVVIEAGWLNKSHWHLTPYDNKQAAAAKGNATGRNHETGRKLVEMLRYWQIPCAECRPLALKVGGCHLWKGRDGKITAEELKRVTEYARRTNQEGRDAALLAWSYAGMPIRCRL